MECPYCNAELEQTDSWGNSDYILRGDRNGKKGDIFKCPNHEGFDSETEAKDFLKLNEETFEDLGVESLEEVTCHSSVHHVSGSFYTDRQENLHNGYPC